MRGSYTIIHIVISEQARQESNLQPPVLETGALPIELRTYVPRPISHVASQSREGG
jgi:hypothetical protein